MDLGAQSTRWFVIALLAALRLGAARLSGRRLPPERRAGHMRRQYIELLPAILFAGLGALTAFSVHVWSRLTDADRPLLVTYLALFAVGYVGEFLIAQHIVQAERVRRRTWIAYIAVGVALLAVAVYVIPPL